VVRAGDVIYARNTGSNGLTADAAISTPATYLDPNLDVTGTNDSISNTDTSASTTIAGMTASETVAVRINNGTTNLATRVGNGARSFTGSLPTFGNTETYELFISRPTTTGGNAAFVATNRTFTVTRAAANSAPTAFDFTNQSDVAINGAERESANTVTIAGLTTGTSLSVSVSGGTYSKNGAAYSSANTTTVNGDTFKLKHNSSTSYSTSTTTTLTVGTGTGSFVTTTIAQDTTPAAFDLQNVGPVAAGTLATTTAVTITGMDANCPCSITGQGSPQLTVGSGGVWTTSSTINPNNTINVRLTAPTAYSSTHTATLTIGTETDTIAVTSAAAPSGSGGTGTTGGTGSYGVKIFDTNGTTSVLSPSTRYMVRLTDPTSISLAATSGSNTLIAVSGMADLSASNSDLIFEQFATVDDVPVTRESNGFRVTNNSGAVFNNIVYAVRF